MNSMRNQIFHEELWNMKQGDFISTEEYEKVKNAYSNYCHVRNMQIQEKQKQKKSDKERISTVQPKPKKVLSSQEIREKNISLVLFLGVFFILMAGLILATTNWSIMNNMTKTIILTMVSVIFFGISVFAEKKLKIKKTSIAFWALGSLMIPISILSAGFFKLFGSWLSIFGEGKYVLGIIGSFICLGVYVYSSFKYKNRLYVWFSFITLSFNVNFILASLYPPRDLFYLGIIIYNSLLLLGYRKLKERKNISLFINELFLFIQFNLGLSALGMLILFENTVFYGLNIILASILYFGIMLIYNKKEYHYVFSILLIYGIYQFVGHLELKEWDIVIFATVGFVFLGLDKYLIKNEMLKKNFKYTSAIVQILVFVYIHFKGLAGNIEEGSIVRWISYILIAFNYMYLSYKTENKIFSYLTSIFLLIAGREKYFIFWPETKHYYGLFMFIATLTIFIIFYYKNNWKYTRVLKEGAAVVTSIYFPFCMMEILSQEQYMMISLLSYVYACVLYILHKNSISLIGKKIIQWIMPFVVLFGTVTIYESLRLYNKIYYFEQHFALSLVLLFGLSIFFEKKNNPLEKSFFMVSQIFILVTNAICPTSTNIFSFISIVAIGAYIYSIFKYKEEFFIRMFLYASFIYFGKFISDMSVYFHVMKNLDYYIPFIVGILVVALWFKCSDLWKKRITMFLIPFNIVSICYINYYFKHPIIDFSFILGYTILMLTILHYEKLQLFNILPLSLFTASLYVFYEEGLDADQSKIFIISIVVFMVLKIAGKLLFNKLYTVNKDGMKVKIVHIDWYSVFSLYMLISVFYDTVDNWGIAGKLIVPVLMVYFFYSQIKRVEEEMAKKIMKTITLIVLMIPYYRLLNNISIPKVIQRELDILPWIGIQVMSSRKIWTKYESLMRKVEWGILIVISTILLADIVVYGDTKDALIFGVLSLISVIGGMQFRKKSYFFVGIGSLIINVIIKNQKLWANIPWWGYLLITGIVLITTASIHEMQKNNKISKLKLNIKEIRNKFKDWK
ncbi:hypothetical protein [Inediibacterium massiliense]|uniref:hypothetical protein n=1 Tax=Inediibacterium massiliense TaxID=1658111 RepID=UPI0006B64628|nr:hypothetical protein [Inediibacterium massiliense]